MPPTPTLTSNRAMRAICGRFAVLCGGSLNGLFGTYFMLHIPFYACAYAFVMRFGLRLSVNTI